MLEARLLDVYEIACLAGGPRRAVDTALVALAETGRVRTPRGGGLTVIGDRPQHGVEAAVLDAIGLGGWRGPEPVRTTAYRDERVVAVADRLTGTGLLSGAVLARLRGRCGGPIPRTAAGRRLLRELRDDPPRRGVAAGTSAVLVALHGPDHLPDADLRAALFGSGRPTAAGPACGLRRRRVGSPATAGDHILSGYPGGTVGGFAGSCDGGGGDGGGGGGC